MRGYGAHQLQSGIGRVTWTIENNSLPQNTSGQLDLYLTDTGSGSQIHFQYKPLAFAGFTIDGVSGQGTTLSGQTLVAGDKVTLEMGGVSFRAYKNGVLLHTMSPGSGLRYPATYWGDIKVDSEKVEDELGRAVDAMREQIERIKTIFQEKIDRLRSGDELRFRVLEHQLTGDFVANLALFRELAPEQLDRMATHKIGRAHV